MQSNATTVTGYIEELPDDRKQALQTVREVILDNLPDGYEEGMQYGMISYFVPMSRFPDTHNGQPLTYAALASQKHYMSIYLMSIYGNPLTEKWFREEYLISGKRMNMGKSCVRFRKLDDLPLDLIGQAVALETVDAYLARYQESRKNRLK